MSIFLRVRALFKPLTVLQLAARELVEAKHGIAHAHSVAEYAKREILQAQSLLEHSEAVIEYNKARTERLETILYEGRLQAIQDSKCEPQAVDEPVFRGVR